MKGQQQRNSKINKSTVAHSEETAKTIIKQQKLTKNKNDNQKQKLENITNRKTQKKHNKKRDRNLKKVEKMKTSKIVCKANENNKWLRNNR